MEKTLEKLWGMSSMTDEKLLIIKLKELKEEAIIAASGQNSNKYNFLMNYVNTIDKNIERIRNSNLSK